MLRRFSIFLFLFLLPSGLFGQSLFGLVSDSLSGKPIPLANIGVLETKDGAYSSENGFFRLNREFKRENPILIVSAIGYKTKRIAISDADYSDTLKVLLNTKKYELKSFTVKGRRIKSKTIGNKRLPLPPNRFGYSAGTSKTRIGKTIAIHVVLHQKPPIWINNMAIAILENPWKQARFRARLMSVHPEKGIPFENLSSVNTITEFKKKAGWVAFDFQENPLTVMHSEFFVVIENIDGSGEPWEPNQIASHFPLFLFNFISLSKQSVFLSNAGLQSWKEIKEDPVFRMTFSFE